MDMLKHGFLIIAHRDPEQLYDLLRLLQAENHYFFINLDKKMKNYKAVMSRILSDIPNVTFEQMEVAHGGYSLFICTLNLLQNSYDAGMDYVHLISGQDFPCRTNKEFDDFFENASGKSFMHYDSEEQHREWSKAKYPSRVNAWYFNDLKYRNFKLIDYFAKSMNLISRRFQWRSRIKGLRAGWQWFSWNRCVVKYVLNSYIHNKKYFKRFKHTSCCDELIFHTLLYNRLEELDIEPHNSLRYIDWNKYVPGRRIMRSPLTLNEEEYEDIIASNAFFCRKIDPNISRQLKQLLANRIIPNFNFSSSNLFET